MVEIASDLFGRHYHLFLERLVEELNQTIGSYGLVYPKRTHYEGSWPLPHRPSMFEIGDDIVQERGRGLQRHFLPTRKLASILGSNFQDRHGYWKAHLELEFIDPIVERLGNYTFKKGNYQLGAFINFPKIKI